MALNVCGSCTTQFAVGLKKCPHCQSTDFQEDGPMPKITAHGGASIAGAEVTGGQWGDDTEPDETPAPAESSAEPEQEEEDGEPAAESSSAAASEEPEEPEPGYEEWTVEQLKEQLAERGLPKSGKRDDLVARLVEDDNARTAETAE
jgi:hypothetical protein